MPSSRNRRTSLITILSIIFVLAAGASVQARTYRCVELSGSASSYLEPLHELLRSKGISQPHNVELDIEKTHRILKLFVGGQLIKTYVAALGRQPNLAKSSMGDKATPVGDYYVCEKNARSRFYMALKLSYPNKSDAERGVREGLIDHVTCNKIKCAINSRQAPPMNTRLGGNICIHGGGAGKVEHRGNVPVVAVRDWTAGCIALENAEMKELFAFVPLGTKVHITP